jgi:phospholipid/cholesterol/gamma-HCH transport system substrate-binding protein
MADRKVEFRVGAVVLFTLGFLGLLLVLNNPVASPFGKGKKEMYIILDQAPGVGINTPVRKDGIPIGYVSAIRSDADGVTLTIRIESDVPIYQSDMAQVEPSSIFGDAVVQFTRGERIGPPIELPAAATIEGTALPDPINALTKLQGDLGPAVQQLGEAGEKVAILADKINLALGDDIGKQRVQAVMDRLSIALDDFSRVMKGVDEILGDQELRGTLRTAIDEIPVLVADARQAVGEARTVLGSANNTLGNIDNVVASAETNLKNIEGITKPLGERGEQLAELIISSIENIDVLSSDLAKFAYALNSSDGTIARLVREPELYDNVNQVVKNVNTVVIRVYQQLQDLRPIMDDIRVFTDKIARNPGSIVRGAVEPSIRK